MREANKEGDKKKEKTEVLKKVKSLGNAGLVAGKHDMPATTIQNWIRKGLKQIRWIKQKGRRCSGYDSV